MTDELKSKLNDVKYYNQQGKNYKVAALLQELMEDYPDSDAVRFQYALYLAKGDTNDVNSAIKILRNLIDENRKNKLAAIYEYIKVCIYKYINPTKEIISINQNTLVSLLVSEKIKT